jgi:hypothetical protein
MGDCVMVRGFIVTEYDRKNLDFLIFSSLDVLKDWYRTASADDLAYAQELFAAYEQQLAYEKFLSDIEMQLVELQENGEFKDAQMVIEKFK